MKNLAAALGLLVVLVMGCGGGSGDSSGPAPDRRVIGLPVDQLTFSQETYNIFRSSLNYRALSSNSGALYFSLFDDHPMVRSGNLLWLMQNSSCLRRTDCGAGSLEDKLANEFQFLNGALRAKHDRLLITIHGAPPWISDYPQQSQSHSPNDYAQWEETVTMVADFMEAFGDIEIWWEIGNEPDLTDQFWLEDTEAFLSYYENTARALRSADPAAKIGGAGVNQYDGRIEASHDPLTRELMDHAAATGVPLDFISWHHYSYPQSINSAIADYEAWAAQTGMQPIWIVSEWSAWNTSVRASYLMNPLYLQYAVDFHTAGVDFQTYYNWEDDHAIDNPLNRFYGLLTREDGGSATPRTTLTVHASLDLLTRDSVGIAGIEQGNMRLLVSPNASGTELRLIIWELNLDLTSPRITQPEATGIQIYGFAPLRVASAFSVLSTIETKTVAVQGDMLLFDKLDNEVIIMRIEGNYP